MKKNRNIHAADAWSRHGGPHSGAKRPEPDPGEAVADGLDEVLDETMQTILGGFIEIDGELLEIEWDFDGDSEEEE